MAGIAEFNSSGIARSAEASATLARPKSRWSKARAEPKYQYTSYGVLLRSEIPLALQQGNQAGDATIEIRSEPASFFTRAIRGASFDENLQEWYRYAGLADLSSYARWEGLGEFLVSSDGRRVHCRRFRGAHSESFQVYLLQRALSFALVKQGLEPLHATAVVVDGQAIAFLGDSGFGKSTLAGCFLADGHELVTDDLLVLRISSAGLRAYPGPPRIKLFPAMARRFLGNQAAGVPMNPQTRKLVLPLRPEQLCSEPVPLKAIYVIQSPRESRRKQSIRLIALDPRQAFIELLRNTYNYLHLAPDRLQRHFTQVSSLANTVRFMKLCHSRVAEDLPAVRDAILTDARGTFEEAACGA